VTGKAICAICNKRRAERFCPAMGESICAVDCGVGREASIDCPSSCSHLIAAHHWEETHSKPLAEEDIPFPDVSFPADVIRARSEIVSGLGYAVLVYAREHPSMTDVEVFEAAHAMAETYRTLVSGIHYEKPPSGAISAGLYAAIAKFIEDEEKTEGRHPETPPLKTTELFHLLVFFLRFGRVRSNGRPRTRAFLDFLRAQYPAEMGLAKQESRIIMP
jgi:hypothetical protein